MQGSDVNRRPPPSSPACPQDSAAIPARWSRRTLLAGLAATASLMAANLRPAAAQQSTPPTGSASPTPVGPARTVLLPRQAMLSLAEVQEIIPAITSETRTSLNLTAMGSPAANCAVTYATPDATQQLVLSVDQYGSADEASGAFQEGVQATQGVPGVTMEAVPALGDGGVIGVVSLGGETHVGGAAASVDRGQS